MADADVLDYCIPHLQRMFPTFDRAWVMGAHVWRARYSQPIVGKHYSRLIPRTDTPIAWSVSVDHGAGLSRGSRHELRNSRRAARRADGGFRPSGE